MISAELDCREKLMNVYNILERNTDIPGVIILKEGFFYRMLSRERFYQIMSKQYMFDLFSRRTVQFFFDDNYHENYLMLNENVPIIEAAGAALQRDDKKRYEPVIVVTANKEYKLLPVQTLLLAQNEIQKSMLGLITEANEFKKDVFRVVAHDLRNPLSSIIGFASLIKGSSTDIEKAKIYAEHISFAANNMNELIKDFLAAAIQDSLDFELHLSVLNLLSPIEKIIANFKNSLSIKQQEIILQPLDTEILVSVDQNKIIEVIENLISNAIKYSGYGKKINVDVLVENDQAIIKVRDEGPGLSENDKEKVFKKFQKLSAKPTGNETSTGLGLYIAKRIIDRHGGKIWVESEYGKGSTFCISLPVILGKNNKGNKHGLLSF
jgi:signal transduction histidine kinase